MNLKVIMLSFLFNTAVSLAKPDTSWFSLPRISKIKSPSLEQIKKGPKKLDSHHIMPQQNRQYLKTITDVIDETMNLKNHLHDSRIADEVKAEELEFKPSGCYADDPTNRALPEFLQDLESSIDWLNLNKTIKICAKLAKEAGYHIFALQKYGLCYSGKNALETYDKYGASKNCVDGVGKEGTNFVYIFELPVVPMKRPTVHCFPKTSKVELPGNHLVTMADVKIGDRVKTLDSRGQPIYSDVIAFLHREQQVVAEYLSLAMEDGRRLKVSSKHLVFRVTNNTNEIDAVYASNIKVGDILKTSPGGQSSVAEITMESHMGIYAPLTRHGTLMADGILVSCYAHWFSHKMAHLSMAPLRMWTDMKSLLTSLSKSLTNQVSPRHELEGIHWYAESLMTIARKFVSLS